MLAYSPDNLFRSTAEVWVNCVNAVGVMGGGIALQFKKRFGDDYFYDYVEACKRGACDAGVVHIYYVRDNQ